MKNYVRLTSLNDKYLTKDNKKFHGMTTKKEIIIESIKQTMKMWQTLVKSVNKAENALDEVRFYAEGDIYFKGKSTWVAWKDKKYQLISSVGGMGNNGEEQLPTFFVNVNIHVEMRRHHPTNMIIDFASNNWMYPIDKKYKKNAGGKTITIEMLSFMDNLHMEGNGDHLPDIISIGKSRINNFIKIIEKTPLYNMEEQYLSR